MKIDIWSDIVCPFCYLGKRRLEAAVATFEHRDELEITWHSYELDRNAPAVSDEDIVDRIANKYGTTREAATAQHESLAQAGADLGVEFNWDRVRHGNTFDAHRVVHLADEQGLADAAIERLMKAYFTDGLPVGDRDTLVQLASEIGLDGPSVHAMLESEGYGNHVRSDEATAKMLGIEGVPFFVFDRKYGVSGAQPPEVFTQALQQAWDTQHEALEPVAAGGGCGGGGCACGGGGCGCGHGGCGGACAP
ncbi:MAG: DsbA family oxidoreductase [Dermatophilaceae bacterium]